QYSCAALIVLYFVFLIFSKTPTREKLIRLKRILLWPSAVMVLGAIALVIFARFMFEWFPFIFPDALLVGFAKNIAYSVAWHVSACVGGVFLAIALVGICLNAVIRFIPKEKK
ncbi:MAG: hypothetical protein N2316_05450, partial [Spirochaetes bacterium]|nr:hypothetical protein [Spirochaetota bacterium]